MAAISTSGSRCGGVTNLLDIGNLGRKALRDLGDNLLDQGLILHGLPGLHDTGESSGSALSMMYIGRDIPNDGGLDHIFTILIYSFQDIRRLGLDFGLDRLVKVDTNLLRLEA